MSNRFTTLRNLRGNYSAKRISERINDNGNEPHRSRPYGLVSPKFTYRQMFAQKNQSRLGNCNAERCTKKTARQGGKRLVRDEADEGETENVTV